MKLGRCFKGGTMGKRFNIPQFPGHKNKVFTLSFDDGVVQDRRLIKLFDKYGMKATFNLGYGVLGYKGESLSPAGRKIDISKVEKEEVKKLYQDHEVGGHGLYHSSLTGIGSEGAMYEIIEDKRCLEDLIEKPVTMFAYPFGHYDDTVVQLLKLAGYKGARTVNSTYRFDLPKDPLILDPTCHYADEKIMDLARQFCESRSFAPQMFYVWGHAYELDGNDDWDRLEELLSYIAQYKDEIWFAGNGQILSYLEACKMLEYSVDGSFVYNPTCTDVDVLTAFGVEEHIAAGKITKLKETSL